MPRELVRLLTAGTLVIAPFVPAWADPNLTGLDCANPLVALTQDQTLTFDHVALRDALISRIQEKVPQLRVDRICSNVLYFRVLATARTTESRRNLGYLAAVRLEVVRSAIVLDTMAKIEMTAWEDGDLLTGPSGDEQAAVLDALNELLDKFAAAYGKAGNP